MMDLTTEDGRGGSRAEASAHSAALRSVLWAHGKLGLPAMTRAERALFKRVLGRVASRNGGHIRVFEYGSGYSTTYYGRWMADQGIDFHLDSVDNHPGWHERIARRVERLGLGDRIGLHMREFDPFWLKPGWEWGPDPERGRFAPATDAEREYVDLPLALGGDYDLIVVDARFRRRCLDVALRATNEDGLVVLHDAQKPHYQVELSAFPVGRMFDSGGFYPLERRAREWKVWIGGRSPEIIEGL